MIEIAAADSRRNDITKKRTFGKEGGKMKKATIIIFTLLVCACAPAFATTQSIDFSPGGEKAGYWYFDGSDQLRFPQGIAVDNAMGNSTEPLVGASVYIPHLTVKKGPDAKYTLGPTSYSLLTIRGEDPSTVYLKATMHMGDLVPVGTTGVGYTNFTADLTDVTITAAGKALNSDVLDAIANMKLTSLDFSLSLQGAAGERYTSFADMLSGGFTGMGGFSGAITIPEPATIALLGLGSLALLRKRRQSVK
jgi:hypothetical protein